MESRALNSAMVLEPGGIQTLDVGSAMKQVVAPLVMNRANSGAAYAVLVYRARRPKLQQNVLLAVQTFLSAYRVACKELENIPDVTVRGPAGAFRVFEASGLDHVRFFFGMATERELQKRVKAAPGVYILTAHLDAGLLKSLDLPLLPKRFRDLPLVMQVENATEPRLIGLSSPAPNVDVAALGGEPAPTNDEEQRADNAIARDTLEWRHAFMRSYPSWTSKDVATQSTSTAKNRAAIASRWQRERKIFGIRYQGQQYFPEFQFLDGLPAPVITEVIDLFPAHATGWYLAYFFTTPNPNIGARKPLELIATNPDRVLSLAHAFAHPGNVF